MPRVLQCLLHDIQGAHEGRVGLDDPIIPHDGKAHLASAATMVAQGILALAPVFPDAQRILAPRAGVYDRLREDLDALEGVRHRAEDGGDALLALLRVDGVAVREALVGRAQGIEAAKRTRYPEGAVAESV